VPRRQKATRVQARLLKTATKEQVAQQVCVNVMSVVPATHLVLVQHNTSRGVREEVERRADAQRRGQLFADARARARSWFHLRCT
jgi:hypothetical protein